jgi:hypothetical protein
LEFDYFIGAARRFLKLDFQVIAEVIATPAARARASPASAEEIAEDVREDFLEALREIETAKAARARLALEGRMPEAIILGPLFRVG